MYICVHIYSNINIYIYVYVYVYIAVIFILHVIYIYRLKMADEVEDQVEESLNVVVITTEQSSNMRKALKQKIYEIVSTLRSLFAKLKDKDDRKTKEINKLTKQVGEMGTKLKQCKERLIKEHRASSMAETTELELAPSMARTTEIDEGRIKKQGATSIVQSTEPAGELTRYVALPNSNRGRNYAEAVQGTKGKTFKMTIKSRGANPPEKFKKS